MTSTGGIAARFSQAATRADWSERITACWRKSFEAVIQTGRLIAEAKEKLEHGDFLEMLERDLPFKPRTAQRLMAVAADARLTNATHASHLPANWTTLYELTKLDDVTFDAKIADGTIRPDMERRDIEQTRKATARAVKEELLGRKITALPDAKFGVILADPEWRFEPWSRKTGMDRAADNHYPTSVTEVIASRPVGGIAADDCILFLWATVPMLPHALLVMEAWGFDYRSHFIWAKDRIGTGYWNRNRHELLLVGVKGDIPAPAMGEQWESLIEAPVGRHSEKPERFLELIEHYFPTLPKIELNRRGPARPNWTPWGNEASEWPDDHDIRTAQTAGGEEYDTTTGEIIESGSAEQSAGESLVDAHENGGSASSIPIATAPPASTEIADGTRAAEPAGDEARQPSMDDGDAPWHLVRDPVERERLRLLQCGDAA